VRLHRSIRCIATIYIAVVVILSASLCAKCDETNEGSIRETRLPNGLVVLTKEVHAAPVVCTYVWYRVGSRNETPGLTGISHQLEHMMFKGTKKAFPDPGYIDVLIGRHGGENNAETTADTTSYYLLLPSDQLDLALRIEADRMTQAAVAPSQLKAENTVVLSELEGDENDNAYFLYEALRAAAFQYHPYHYPVIGTKWDVQHFTRTQVYDFYRTHYAPNNAALVIVGDFDTSKILARVRQLWADVRSAEVPHPALNPEPPQRGERRVTVRRAGTNVYLDMSFHIPRATNPDLFPLDVVSTVLASGRSSRLYRALVEAQLATSVAADSNDGIDPELFDITVAVRPGVAPKAIEKVLLAELDRLQKEPLTDHELQKAKNQTRSGFVFGQESVLTQAERIGFFQMVFGDWHHLNSYLPGINSVTAGDVQRVARTYFTSDNRTVGIFLPNGEKPNPESDSGGSRAIHYKSFRTVSAQSNHESVRQSVKAGQGRDTARKPSTGKSPVTQQRKLTNGLTVIVRENHAVPTVTISGFVRTGSVQDPIGKYGIADLAAEMLTRGTETHSSQQIADMTDYVGANLGTSAGRERTDLSASMLTRDFPAILNLLAEVVRHPSFPPEELEKAKGETLAALQEEESDTASVVLRRLYTALYAAENPYQHEPLGNAKDVKSITTDDVQAFYRRAYHPERTTLIIVGDVKAEAVFTEVEREFGDWKSEGQAFPEYGPPELTQSGNAPPPLALILPDKSQDDIAMGLVALSRKSPDYDAAHVMNLILGEDTFVGRVGKRVRDTEGLAYYAYTMFVPTLENGPWMFRAGVNPKNVPQAIRSAREEIRKMVAGGVTEEELAWAKDNAIGSLQMGLATNGGMASMLVADAFYGLGLDYSDRYPHIIHSLTRSQVNATARKYLKPDGMAVVVAGPPVADESNHSKKENQER
jgi:zinc protease